MRVTVLCLALLLAVASAQMVNKPVPMIPDDYSVVVEITRPTCSPPMNHGPFPGFHRPCPHVETFHEFHDYTNNKLRIVHSGRDETIYHFDHQAGFRIMSPLMCESFNVTRAENMPHHHGELFPSEYNPVTDHLTTAAQTFLLAEGNPMYGGMTPYPERGIATEYWTGQVTRQINATTMVVMNITWHFSLSNWTFNDGAVFFDHAHNNEDGDHMHWNMMMMWNVTQMLVSMHIEGAVFSNMMMTHMFHEDHNFVDFHFFVDQKMMRVPPDAFCAELINLPMPTLPASFGYTVEMNDLHRNFSDTHRFFYDYTNNQLRTEHWNNDAYYISIFDVTKSQNTTFSWHDGCDEEPIMPDEFRHHHLSFIDRIIDFSTHQLYPAIQAYGANMQTMWRYGGRRKVRDIETQMWFSMNMSRFMTPNDQMVFDGEVVAWYFSLPSWKIGGLPDETTVPVRVTRIHWFFDPMDHMPRFFTRHHEFTDVKYNVEPRVFDLPAQCPGSSFAMSSDSNSGVSKGGAAALAICMFIAGGGIVGAAVWYVTKKKQPQDTNAYINMGEK